MDFMNRGNRPVQPNTQTPESNLAGPKAPENRPSKTKGTGKLSRFAYPAFAVALAVLILAVLSSLVFVKDTATRESDQVNGEQLQAVFLNGGQVYFGDISQLNSRYLTLDNIYYLRVNQQVQPNQQNNQSAQDISLVKLGCELHGPEDSMVINREQIIFWENLKGDGQVAKAVEEYVKANPDGQKCEQQNSSGNNNSGSNNGAGATTPSSQNSGSTTPATP